MRRSAEVSSEEASYLFLLANFERRAGNDAAAEVLFRRLTEADPSFASYSALGAFLAQGRERDQEAERAFRAALERAEGEDRMRAFRASNWASLAGHATIDAQAGAKSELVLSLQGDTHAAVACGT